MGCDFGNQPMARTSRTASLELLDPIYAPSRTRRGQRCKCCFMEPAAAVRSSSERLGRVVSKDCLTLPHWDLLLFPLFSSSIAPGDIAGKQGGPSTPSRWLHAL